MIHNASKSVEASLDPEEARTIEDRWYEARGAVYDVHEKLGSLLATADQFRPQVDTTEVASTAISRTVEQLSASEQALQAARQRVDGIIG